MGGPQLGFSRGRGGGGPPPSLSPDSSKIPLPEGKGTRRLPSHRAAQRALQQQSQSRAGPEKAAHCRPTCGAGLGQPGLPTSRLDTVAGPSPPWAPPPQLYNTCLARPAQGSTEPHVLIHLSHLNNPVLTASMKPPGILPPITTNQGSLVPTLACRKLESAPGPPPESGPLGGPFCR